MDGCGIQYMTLVCHGPIRASDRTCTYFHFEFIIGRAWDQFSLVSACDKTPDSR